MENRRVNDMDSNSDWFLKTKERIARILQDRDFCKDGLGFRDRELLKQLLNTEKEYELPMPKHQIDEILKQIEKNKDNKKNHEITCEEEGMGLC